MTSLGVSVLVPALVSAFNAVAAEYRAWLEKVVERADSARNRALRDRLSEHGPAVGADYTRLSLVGTAFGEGDETGRAELMQHLVVLQTVIVALLRDRLDDASIVVHPNHDLLFDASQATREGCIAALADQHRRLSEPVPDHKKTQPIHTAARAPIHALPEVYLVHKAEAPGPEAKAAALVHDEPPPEGAEAPAPDIAEAPAQEIAKAPVPPAQPSGKRHINKHCQGSVKRIQGSGRNMVLACDVCPWMQYHAGGWLTWERITLNIEQFCTASHFYQSQLEVSGWECPLCGAEFVRPKWRLFTFAYDNNIYPDDALREHIRKKHYLKEFLRIGVNASY